MQGRRIEPVELVWLAGWNLSYLAVCPRDRKFGWSSAERRARLERVGYVA